MLGLTESCLPQFYPEHQGCNIEFEPQSKKVARTMKKIKRFILRRPFIFGLLFMLIYSLLATVAYPVHFLFPENEAGIVFGDAVVKILVFAVFTLFLWRFGWLKASGLVGKGSRKIWLVTCVALLYLGVVELFAFTGNLTITFPDPQLAWANLTLGLGTGLLEETFFRAIVLVAMISAWGHTKQGIVKAIVLSSVLFGMTHLVNLMIRPWQVVVFQAAVVSLPGIFYAALVLTGRSLWPVILIHALTNAVVDIQIITIESFQETTSMWIAFTIGLIPLMVYSIYIIRKLPFFYDYEEENSEKLFIRTSEVQVGD